MGDYVGLNYICNYVYICVHTYICQKYQRKSRQIEQWNRIKSPEGDPHKYSQLIFDKEAKAI